MNVDLQAAMKGIEANIHLGRLGVIDYTRRLHAALLCAVEQRHLACAWSNGEHAPCPQCMNDDDELIAILKGEDDDS